MNLRSYIHNTLSARLSFWVSVIAMVLFVAVIWILLWFVHRNIEEEATEKARAALDAAALTIDNELREVETAVRNMQWIVEQHIDKPDSIGSLSHLILESNPIIEGCNIAFRTYYYPERGRNFMVYCFREGDDIVCIDDYAEDDYDELPWFTSVIKSDSAKWIDPSELTKFSAHAVTSYSVAIHGKDGREIVGVLSATISLDKLSQNVQDARPLPSAFCSLLNQQGSFIIHRDMAMLAPGSLKKQIRRTQDKDGDQLAKAMMNGESGTMVLQFGDQDFYFFYKPFRTDGWSLNIVCPESELFASFHKLLPLAVILTVVGLVVLLLFCSFHISWQLRPLFRLDASTRQLAAGNFDHLLDDTRRADEIGNMQRIFREMQLSIAAYLDKIAKQRKSLDEQGEALRRVYEHTVEAEQTKSNFMHSTTDGLTPPATAIARIVGRIHEGHAQLTHEEIVALTGTIESETKAITDILDSMIKVSSESITPAT